MRPRAQHEETETSGTAGGEQENASSARTTERTGNRRGGRRRSDVSAGRLVLIGGGASPQGAAMKAFLAAADATSGGRIVGFTTASSDPVASAYAWRSDLELAGATNVEIPIVDRRARAQDRRIARMVREAQGIFLGGGDQVQLVATLAGSAVADAIRDAHSGGAVVCGSSAGAAALTEIILAGGEPDEMGRLVDMHIGPGLGLLGFHAVIDTHFGERRRLQRLFMAIASNPQLLGLGIDEDTALVVDGHLGEVIGAGGMTFVDGRDVQFDNADEVATGGTLTLSHLRVGIVGSGYVFNLREKELEVLVSARDFPEEVPSVKGKRPG